MPGLISPGLQMAGGIGQGLLGGVNAFMQARQQQQENRLANAKMGLLASQSGYDYDPQSGAITPNAYGNSLKAARQSGIDLQQKQQEQALRDLNSQNDPDSDVSKAARGFGKAYMGILRNTTAYKRNPDDFSGIEDAFTSDSSTHHSIMTLADKLKPLASEAIGEDRVNAMMNRFAAAAGQKTDAAEAKKAKDETKADTDFKNSLQRLDSYKQADTAANSADALIDTVNNATANKASAASLPTELANFASRGKRLHTATVDAFTNPNSDILTRIKSGIARSTTGTIPQDVAADIAKYLQAEKESAAYQKAQVIKSEAEDFKNIHGRYPKIYNPETAPTAAPKGLTKDSKIQDYATQYGLQYDQAEKILKGRGYGQ